MRRLAVLCVLVALFVGIVPTPADAGSGSTNGGYPTQVLCEIGPTSGYVALASSSYADPFFGGNWLAQSSITGWSTLGGCSPFAKYGSATHASLSTRLIVLRNTFGGWVNCGDFTDYTTGTSDHTASVAFGGLTTAPSACRYLNWPAGQTYITGHWRAQYNRLGSLSSPGTITRLVNYGYYV